MARLTKYDTHVAPYLKRIPAWRKQGLTEKQVAQRLGIAYSTLRKYEGSDAALAAALKKGKEELIEELEDSLYRRALGYDYTETEQIDEHKGGIITTRTKVNRRHSAPDVGALAFALKNLDPKNWRDRHNDKPAEEEDADKLKIDFKAAIIRAAERRLQGDDRNEAKD